VTLELNEQARGEWNSLVLENPLRGFEPHPCPVCRDSVHLLDAVGRESGSPCEGALEGRLKGPHREPQFEFLNAKTRIQAAFCGNRFGKTVALTVKILVQHCPLDILPAHLRPFKQVPEGRPAMGRLLVPGEKAFLSYSEPELKRWVPQHLLRGGSWAKAWSKEFNILHFADGGQMAVYTYSQDPSAMPGSSLDYVAYDEPPPLAHRNECWMRLTDRRGFEMYGLTPVNMQGGGIGWLYQRIWKRREDPKLTVVNASIHDNPLMDAEAVEEALAEYGDEDDPERRAREFGHFTHIGGLVYDGGFERVLVDPLEEEQVRSLDVVVGLDPGLNNAAFVWVGFDKDNRGFVFHEVLLRDRDPADYVIAIALANVRWGLGTREERHSAWKALKELLDAESIGLDEFDQKAAVLRGAPTGKAPLYVVDPSAKNRSLTNRDESVEKELQRLGLFALRGDNAVEAGLQHLRRRMRAGALFVSKACAGLRDEADEYRKKERPDGEFEVVKENDHRLDALRYAVMTRSYWRPPSSDESHNRLGAAPVYEPDIGPYRAGEYQSDSPPLGVMS
jgi:hypothetical protein